MTDKQFQRTINIVFGVFWVIFGILWYTLIV